MKNSADLGGCYPPRPLALVDNTLLDLQNSSYPTQPHSIFAKYSITKSHMIFLEQFGIKIFSKTTNRPFRSSCLPPLQSKSKCKIFVMVISSTMNKN